MVQFALSEFYLRHHTMPIFREKPKPSLPLLTPGILKIDNTGIRAQTKGSVIVRGLAGDGFTLKDKIAQRIKKSADLYRFQYLVNNVVHGR